MEKEQFIDIELEQLITEKSECNRLYRQSSREYKKMIRQINQEINIKRWKNPIYRFMCYTGAVAAALTIFAAGSLITYKVFNPQDATIEQKAEEAYDNLRQSLAPKD